MASILRLYTKLCFDGTNSLQLLRKIVSIHRKLYRLEKGRVITVTKPRNLLLILDGYYIPGLTVNEFLTVFSWSRSIFYVRRRELVMVTGEYLRG